MLRASLIIAFLALAVGACSAPVPPPAPAAPQSTAEHVERDLDQLVTATIGTNAMLSMFARHDPAMRDEFLGAARAANARAGMDAARTEIRNRVTASFNRYSKRFVPHTSDESAVTFGRAAQAFLTQLNSHPDYNCSTTDVGEFVRRRADIEAPFGTFLRAFDQVIISAKTSPRPAPPADLYLAEFATIERRVIAAMQINPASLRKDPRLMTAQEKVMACRMFEFFLRDVLAYRTESAGPMIRAMYAALPDQ